MKIENRTHWSTEDLRAIISRIADVELDPDAQRRLRLRIEYTRRKRAYSSGFAFYPHPDPVIAKQGRLIAIVRISKHEALVDKVDFAHVVAHEMAHTRGMRHRQMTGSPRYTRVGDWRELYAWAEAMPITLAPVKAKARPGPVEKLDAARSMLAEWERKTAHARRFVRKWERKVRHYTSAVAKRGLDDVVLGKAAEVPRG